jgi:hypothetical protein
MEAIVNPPSRGSRLDADHPQNGALFHADLQAYDPKDRKIAAEVDAIAFAISARREAGLLIAEAEKNDLQPAS